MVKVKNANVGRGENYEEGGSSRGERTRKGKGRKVTSEPRLPKRFISVTAVAKFEERTRKRRKIAPGHRNKHTFKRMGFSRNEEGVDEEEKEEDEGQDTMNVDEEVRREKYKLQHVVDGIMYFVDGIMLMPYDVDSLSFVRRTKHAQNETQG
ncbi:hypothetical protein M9H77_08696 [Catharanthus roseus]|uniref:Uncharacterized protein n=1 Tax=Catharanthus roseus TaxID=4058 RepID=A0ACC0BYJ8_CATRO|nr:hypothetical protein M9H77_08696 [Catharanthus roseus]